MLFKAFHKHEVWLQFQTESTATDGAAEASSTESRSRGVPEAHLKDVRAV